MFPLVFLFQSLCILELSASSTLTLASFCGIHLVYSTPSTFITPPNFIITDTSWLLLPDCFHRQPQLTSVPKLLQMSSISQNSSLRLLLVPSTGKQEFTMMLGSLLPSTPHLWVSHTWCFICNRERRMPLSSLNSYKSPSRNSPSQSSLPSSRTDCISQRHLPLVLCII